MLPFLRLLYDLGIGLYGLGIRMASVKNEKAREWLKGRQNLFVKIREELKGETGFIWFHCASLGEFEQGRPVIEKIKQEWPGEKILLTFFSPSGYEQRKNYAFADHVFYLPIDTRKNAERFVELTKPKLAVFVKYEFWYHYFEALHQKSIPLIMLSSIFRDEQPFFKWYGELHRKMLSCVKHFFVQDEQSKELLGKAGFNDVTVIPDTRIDRVAQIAGAAKPVPVIEAFLEGEKAFIGGSIYDKENKIIHKAYQKALIKGKIILVPHKTDVQHVNEIAQLWGEDAVLYTDLPKNQGKQYRVLILDTVGMLSALYQYGSIAFIGGGFGKGIHNALEPAAFGLPVVFGPRYEKFIEAREMLKAGGAFCVEDEEEFLAVLKRLNEPAEYQKASSVTTSFIKDNTGGTERVWKWMRENILMQ